MCNLSKGIEEIGLREGKKEGILFSIQSLMETMNFTMEEAMNALKISKNRAGTIYKEIETEIDLYKKVPYRTITKKGDAK